jgi:hypothetical protein
MDKSRCYETNFVMFGIYGVPYFIQKKDNQPLLRVGLIKIDPFFMYKIKLSLVI